MFLYYVIATLSVLLYLHGFFPIPARSSPKPVVANGSESNPHYQKTVLMVIDALRLDFVTATNTPFLWKTHKDTGCFIQLKVESPTVTLPRIKALTTGNVPQFIDIILNLANPTMLEDSFVHRAHARNKKIVFYGDDIWLKLFPKQFERSEGTSSFFVNDYTEVDTNVTRNVINEIHRSDWDIMILHYLGLDHIGHVYGPRSPLIATKLKEMDGIIEEMYTTIKDKTLFMITGDHGMRDSGGHGGSTFPETHVPLLVLGMPCIDSSFAQIDVPVNLAALLDFDIPATSIGQLQFSLLGHLSMADRLEALKHNAFVLRNKSDLCGESLDTAMHLHDLFLINHKKDLGENAVKLYEDCCRQISDSLLKTSVQQNIGSLVISVLAAVYVIIKILQNFLNLNSNCQLGRYITLVVLLLQFWTVHPVVTVASSIVILMLNLQSLSCFDFKCLKQMKLSFLAVMSILHPLSFLSSSFLEEEHQFWYFFTNTFLLFELVNNKKYKRWLFIFAAIRFLRTINQVGDKWSAEPDLADWFLQSDNYYFLQIIFVVGLSLSFYCNVLLNQDQINMTTDGIVLFLIYLYHTVLGKNIIMGQILWLLIFLKLFYCRFKKHELLPVWVLIANLLLAPYNVILIPFAILTSLYFHKAVSNTKNLVLLHWWLGNLLFFAQGHDNSLASVDISSGYVGLSEYEPLLVFPQVLCHTYAFPVLTNFLLFRNKTVNIKKYFSLFVMLKLYVVVIVFMVTFIHRHHLFIWSVFAPKMFVEASHFGILFVQICCYYLNHLVNKISLLQ